tara:strand:+ start:372 stop:659 length:288 start_codon:yes stop_codon:yes gene_type:complete
MVTAKMMQSVVGVVVVDGVNEAERGRGRGRGERGVRRKGVDVGDSSVLPYGVIRIGLSTAAQKARQFWLSGAGVVGECRMGRGRDSTIVLEIRSA